MKVLRQVARTATAAHAQPTSTISVTPEKEAVLCRLRPEQHAASRGIPNAQQRTLEADIVIQSSLQVQHELIESEATTATAKKCL